MKIGILGGTFDPIHQGHLLLARAAQKQFSLDKVLFIPALIPPHKTHKRDMTPAPYRYRMVELALKGQSDFEISHEEFDRPEVSYTVDTLKALHQKYPGSRFYLIVGADAISEIQSWKDPEEIRKLAVIAAAQRPAHSMPRREAAGFEPIEMKESGLSSSDIREKLRCGESLGVSFLPEEVESYIRKMNLYSRK